MNITFTKSELLELLGINNYGYNYLVSTNQLEYKLSLKGYKIESKYKNGRNVIFELSLIEVDDFEVYQDARNIRNKEEHMEYIEERLESGLSKTRRSVVKTVNERTGMSLSESKAKRYDRMLIEDECMVKDETVYLLFNPKTETFEEITEEGYKAFWRDNKECEYQLSHNHYRYTHNEITESTYENNRYMILNNLGNECGVIAMKFDTYKEYTNTLNMLEMIKKHKARRRNIASNQ